MKTFSELPNWSIHILPLFLVAVTNLTPEVKKKNTSCKLPFLFSRWNSGLTRKNTPYTEILRVSPVFFAVVCTELVRRRWAQHFQDNKVAVWTCSRAIWQMVSAWQCVSSSVFPRRKCLRENATHPSTLKSKHVDGPTHVWGVNVQVEAVLASRRDAHVLSLVVDVLNARVAKLQRLDVPQGWVGLGLLKPDAPCHWRGQKWGRSNETDAKHAVSCPCRYISVEAVRPMHTSCSIKALFGTVGGLGKFVLLRGRSGKVSWHGERRSILTAVVQSPVRESKRFDSFDQHGGDGQFDEQDPRRVFIWLGGR